MGLPISRSDYGFGTIAGATLLTPDAAVTVTLYDASGATLGSSSFSCGVRAHEVLTTPVPVVSTYSVWSGGLFAPASATALVTPTGDNGWKLSVVAAAYHDDNTSKAQIQSHASGSTPVCPTSPRVCSFPQGQILVVDANGKSTSVVLNSGSNPFPLMVDSSASAGNPVFIDAGWKIGL